MGYKSINNVRANSHRALAIKVIMDGVAAQKSHEEIVNDIFAAVSGNGGAISHSTKYGWYNDLRRDYRNPDGTELAPEAPAGAGKRRTKPAEAATVSEEMTSSLEEATEALKSPAELAAEAATVPTDDDELPADLVADLKEIVEQPAA